jgi:pimeloyl-ACP methyl ester carboxylesterase
MTTDLSIYKSPEGKAKCLAVYDAALTHWPVPYEQVDVPTRFGSTHVIASGLKDAPPLVLLHGNWATAMMWSSAIVDLSREHRTYALDQIDDVGKSIPTSIPASRSDYAEWLLDVFNQLGLQQADIVGLSYGGFLAANFALCAPDRVKRLILLCPGVPSFGPPTRKYAIHGLPLMLFPSRLTGKWLIRGLSVKGYQSDDLEAEQLIVSAMNLRSRVPFRPTFSDDEFGKLKMPVLLLIGAREVLYDARSAIDRARQLIPHVEAEIIPNAGHMLSTDQPEEVMRRVMTILHQGP